MLTLVKQKSINLKSYGAELKVVRGEGADGDVVQKWTSTDVQKQLSLKKEPTQWLKLKLQMDMK